MSLFTETIRVGFEELAGYAETTARFGDKDYPCLQGETQEIATLVIGGVDEQLDGVLVFLKSDFESIPRIGRGFIYGNDYLRVETITTDKADPTFTIAFSKLGVIEGIPTNLGDPSVPCFYVDGGGATHRCE